MRRAKIGFFPKQEMEGKHSTKRPWIEGAPDEDGMQCEKEVTGHCKNSFDNTTGIKGQRAIAKMTVFAKWHAAGVVQLLQEEDNPLECDNLAVDTESLLSREHLQLMVTHLPRKNGGKTTEEASVPGTCRLCTLYLGSANP